MIIRGRTSLGDSLAYMLRLDWAIVVPLSSFPCNGPDDCEAHGGPFAHDGMMNSGGA